MWFSYNKTQGDMIIRDEDRFVIVDDEKSGGRFLASTRRRALPTARVGTRWIAKLPEGNPDMPPRIMPALGHGLPNSSDAARPHGS